MCNWDEDVVTMAVEAARDALAGATALPLRRSVCLDDISISRPPARRIAAEALALRKTLPRKTSPLRSAPPLRARKCSTKSRETLIVAPSSAARAPRV